MINEMIFPFLFLEYPIYVALFLLKYFTQPLDQKF